MEFEGRSRIRAHLDLAPLIDIVFLLLVFFMLTSTFLIPAAIELELPESETADAQVPEGIVVALDKAGRVAVNGVEVPWEGLRERLAALIEAQPQAAVVLRSDARSEVQQLLRLMDEIRVAGGSDIVLATLPTGGSNDGGRD